MALNLNTTNQCEYTRNLNQYQHLRTVLFHFTACTIFQVRNLSYMISRREKMKKQFSIARESVFYATLEVLTDKHLNISKREVEKIVKQYKEVPDPYCNFRKKAKSITKQVSVKSVTQNDTASDRRESKSPSPFHEGDIASKSLNTDSEIMESDRQTDKSEPKAKKALLQTPEVKKSESGTAGQKDEEETIGKAEDKNSSFVEMDTSISMDVENANDTLVNTSVLSQASSADTVTQSESETVKNNAFPTNQGSKRGRKKKSLVAKSATDTSVKEETPSVKTEETSEESKPVKRPRGRPKKNLSTPQGEVKEESETKISEKLNLDKKPSIDQEKITARERRQSASIKISEEEKEKLIHTFPSAKNVSDQIKAELNGYFKNNKLVVSNKIKQKVQNSLLNSKRRSRFSNGIIIDHSQKKIDNYFVKSPPTFDPSAHKSPAKSVSRVLNELSPTRDRFEANNIERTMRTSVVKLTDFQLQKKSPHTRPLTSPVALSRETSPDRRSTRSNCSSPVLPVKDRQFESSHRRSRKSRESSPDSVKSYSSLKLEKIQKDKERIRTRSLTPSGKDFFESDIMDTENTFESKRKSLRNRQFDTREGSRSPQSLLKSQISS